MPEVTYIAIHYSLEIGGYAERGLVDARVSQDHLAI